MKLHLKTVFVLTILIGFSSMIFAQRAVDLGFHYGIASYDGDFTPGKLFNDFSSKNRSYRFRADYRFNPRLSLGGAYMLSHLESADKQSTPFSESSRSEFWIRHNYFKTNVNQFILNSELNILRFDTREAGFLWTPYVGLELNYQTYKPKDENGTLLSEINPQNKTEDPDDYNGKITGHDWALDYTAGLKVRVFYDWYVDLNFTYVNCFRDDLDGVTNFNNEVFAVFSGGIKYSIPLSSYNRRRDNGIPRPVIQ